MGSSDLNLKKSWHVGRAANISAIAKAEADAIAERKKMAQRLSEIKEERKKEEIQKQLAEAGGKPVTQRVEWMYSGGPGDGQGDSVANEAFLLGKRTLDKLLVSQDNETKQLQKQATGNEGAAPAPSAGASSRDTAAKIREDPLLAIRRSEADAYSAMMNDPIRRRQLLASIGIDDAKQKSRGKEEERHHHKHRHHHRRRRLDSDSDGGRSRHRRRSDSRERSRSPRRYDADEERRRRRRRADSRERLQRSRSPRRHDSDEERRRRRRRSRSRAGDEGGGYRDKRDNGRRGHSEPDRPRQGADEDERARKLAAMQEAASDLDQGREKRLAAIEEADRAAREADDQARQRAKKYGGGHKLIGI